MKRKWISYPIPMAVGAVATVIALTAMPATAGHGYKQSGAVDGTAPESVAAPAGIRELLEGDSRLSLFARALKRTDIWSELDKGNGVTVFVPSDRALKAEGSAYLLDEVLVTDANRQRLRDLVLDHVYVGGPLDPADIGNLQLETAGGVCFPIHRVGSGIRVGPEAVVTDHVLMNEGSLIVIDRLLWRPWTGGDHCHEPGRAAAVPGHDSLAGPARAGDDARSGSDRGRD